MDILNEKIKKIEQSVWDVKTKYLVLVGYYDYDVSWVLELDLPYVIYFKDMPDKAPYTARNKAKGETNILRFIIDFYDSLPQNIVNVHQYDHKWYHKGSLVNILNPARLDKVFSASKTPGFVSINNRPIAILQAINDEISNMESCGFWDSTMKPYFGTFKSCGNFTEGKSGCSQFIVSRDRIRSLPRKFYENMYDWLINNVVDELPSSFNPKNLRRIKTPGFANPLSNHCTSRYLEWTWELIFTCFKMSELPALLSQSSLSNKNFLVLYGADGYFRDITQLFIAHIDLKNKKQIITPGGPMLTQLFGDHIIGTVKYLYIIYNSKVYSVCEKSGSITIEL